MFDITPMLNQSFRTFAIKNSYELPTVRSLKDAAIRAGANKPIQVDEGHMGSTIDLKWYNDEPNAKLQSIRILENNRWLTESEVMSAVKKRV